MHLQATTTSQENQIVWDRFDNNVDAYLILRHFCSHPVRNHYQHHDLHLDNCYNLCIHAVFRNQTIY